MFSSPNTIQSLDRPFWIYHLWLPLLFALPTLYLFEQTSLDIAFADFWFQLEGGDWALRKHWFTYELMHHWGKRLVITLGLSMFVLYIASWKVDRLRPWRWSFIFSFLGMVLLPSLITSLKHLSSTPCPWDTIRFGGSLAYTHDLHFASIANAGHCFPAAHASGGFGLFSLYFAFYPFVTKYRYRLLLPGLVLGISFGFAQQLRGAHFISHDLWSLAICWFGALLLFKFALRFKSPGIRIDSGEAAP